MRRQAALLGVALGIGFSANLAIGSEPRTGAATLPAGFVEDEVVDGFDHPVAMAWLPDGRFLLAEKVGRLYVIDPATAGSTLLIDMTAEVNSSSDRGLVGLAVDPGFAGDPWVYVSYNYDPPQTQTAALYWDGDGSTHRQLSNGYPDGQGQRVIRLDRFRLDPATGYTTVVAGSREIVLGSNSTWDNIGDPYTFQADVDAPWTCAAYEPGDQPPDGSPITDCLPSDGVSHGVGALRFASDGTLFASFGDAASFNRADPRALRALDPDWLAGKVLHIDPDSGRGVAGNPHADVDLTSNRSRVYFSGLRNPFRFALTAGDRPVTGDVGWGSYEEIDTGAPGTSFGWPCLEGGLTDTDLSERNREGPGINRAQASYDDLPACAPFYDGSQTAPTWTWCHRQVRSWCSATGHSAMAGVDYTGTVYPPAYRGVWFGDVHQQWMSVMHLDGTTATVTPVSTDVLFAVDMSIGPDGNVYYVSYFGSVERIRYVGGANVQPHAVASADVTSGPVPLVVQFTGSGSTDPDGDPVTYLWDFGDGTTSTDPSPSHTYTAPGAVVATLTVTDPSGATGTATVHLTPGNTAPVPVIEQPLDGSIVAIDTMLDLAGSATDADDGALSGTALVWSGTLHHNDHAHHDAFVRTGEHPEGYRFADHDDDTFMEICLTATDTAGLSGVACVDVYPAEVDLTFESSPPGLEVAYNGQQHETPFTVRVPAGVARNIDAPSPQGGYEFSAWDIGGGRAQVITTPSSDATITATFGEVTTPRVLYVAGAATTPAPDVPLVEHLRGRGFDVTVVDDRDLSARASAAGYDLVWVSSTVDAPAVGGAFASVPVPLGLHEAFLYDDNRLATTSGERAAQTRIRDTASGANVLVTTASRTYSWATVAPAATVVATQVGNTARATVFSYDAGVALTDGLPAPSCRGGYLAGHDTPAVLNAAGWAYFDELVDGLLACGSEPNHPPTIGAVADRTDTEGDAVDIALATVDIDRDVVVHSATGLPPGIAIDGVTGRLTGAASAGASLGSPYAVTVTATDAHGALTSTSFTWTIEPDLGTTPTVLFVAGSATRLGVDAPLVERWLARGFDVTVVDDNALISATEAESYDLVWVSASVQPGLVANRYAMIHTSLGTHEAYLYDDNLLATKSGVQSGQRTVRNVASGLVDVVASAQRSFSWAQPGPAAHVIATQSNNGARAMVFTYDRGDALTDGTLAPGCRGGYFAGPQTPVVTTAVGWGYFDDLTDRLLGCG